MPKRNARAAFVEIRHEETGATASVPSGAVKHYERNGWTQASDVPDEPAVDMPADEPTTPLWSAESGETGGKDSTQNVTYEVQES